jgi:hypothetical protein
MDVRDQIFPKEGLDIFFKFLERKSQYFSGNSYFENEIVLLQKAMTEFAVLSIVKFEYLKKQTFDFFKDLYRLKYQV